MKTRRTLRIVLAVLAACAAAVLFVTCGTVSTGVPFASMPLDKPTISDSDGKLTVVVDGESRRALIVNSQGELTGIVSTTTLDSPFDAITDACVADGLVYLAGVSFEPDSEAITQERVAVYDRGGNFKGNVYELPGGGDASPSIRALKHGADGVIVARWSLNLQGQTEASGEGADNQDQSSIGNFRNHVTLDLVNMEETYELKTIELSNTNNIHDAAFSPDDTDRYVALTTLGNLEGSAGHYDPRAYSDYVFTSIDIDSAGTLYACDDRTGALVVIPAKSAVARSSSSSDRLSNVHENSGTVSLCSTEANKVTLCSSQGEVLKEFSEVSSSAGFSARMLSVWASAIYLGALAAALGIRKFYRLVKSGRTEGIGPMLLAVAIVTALAVAIGNLSFSSYQKSLELRANEINMCADYFNNSSADIGESMKGIRGRDALRQNSKESMDALFALIDTLGPVMSLVGAAGANDIGLYFNLYGSDKQGVFYLYGSAGEYVMGTAAREWTDGELKKTFESDFAEDPPLLTGRTLRDTAQYRLVKIHSPEDMSVIGVIEIGSKMHSFEASIAASMAQSILALLVMVLVVYLAYSELRACGRCLFRFRQHQRANETEAIAVLTRPFTLAITLLSSIDSIMTVLIARDLLAKTDMGATSPLVALPAVMLGAGLVVGQALYGFTGSRVGLRRLMAGGAFAMMLCASLTALAVSFGSFWVYCAAKFAMAAPFGLLYALGYSLPRLAQSDDVRATADGGVKRTDASAAALGTVLGGYAAQALGNEWVYALVAIACIPVIIMALNLLPRGLAPLERMAQPEQLSGHILNFVKSPGAIALALFVALPATVAAGYASFLFPLFSADLGLQKADINNVVVLGQVLVFVCIGGIERADRRWGKWKVSMVAIALLGSVFLLFSVNTTLVWSFAVIALVALLCNCSDGWKAMWLEAAGESGVASGRATSAMLATRSLALIAQPFILSALLGAANSLAVIVIGLFCAACAALFFLVTRRSSLAST